VKRFLSCAVLAALFLASASARGDVFGSGSNTFSIDFVNIGNPGNPADTTGSPNPAGSVAYTYRMGKYEISEQMIEKANAAGALGITKDTRGPDMPATSVTWFEAARFVNWLNASTGSVPAYKFVEIPGRNPTLQFALWEPSDAGYSAANRYRNSLSTYFLPSIDEWYKAAYYDPVTGVYWDYPTGSNSPPLAVTSGTAAGTAILHQGLSAGPADIFQAGGLSPFGTMAQGGNVYEWEETESDLVNDDPLFRRSVRGGFWDSTQSALLALAGGDNFPTSGVFNVGFRIASVVPEPTSMTSIGVCVITVIWCRRRYRD
jgi:formylglycine-generating enzyme required for sulfatase activity